MSTTTGNNNLPVPTSTDTPDVPRDVTALANAVDPLLGPYVCTSTTRPASPKPGQRVVFETDTGRLSFWNGSVWVPISPVPFCALSDVAGEATTAAAYNAVAFGTEVYDPDGFHSTTANTSRITPTIPGWYRFTANVGLAEGSSANFVLCLQKNGSNALRWQGTRAYGVTGFDGEVTATVQMNGTTDYMEALIYCNLASTIDTLNGGPTFECAYVRP